MRPSWARLSRTAADRLAAHGAGVALLIAASVLPAAAAPCETPPGFAPRARVEAAGVTVLFRTVPETIEVGRHFVVEAVVCPRAPGLRVDGRMPEHRHGMNYRPRVSAREDGVHVAEGLLFHMPGHWQLVFDVEHGGRTERLVTDVVLE